MLQKPVFENNEALEWHYVLGHKAFALKELHERQFLACPFPTIFPDHYGWAKCEEKLTDWVQMVLHFGIKHHRLFYLMVQDRYDNYYDISQRLFPYAWHYYYKL